PRNQPLQPTVCSLQGCNLVSVRDYKHCLSSIAYQASLFCSFRRPVYPDPLLFCARAAKLGLLASIGAATDRDPRRREVFEGAKEFAILKETGDTQGHHDAVTRLSPSA